MDLFAVVCFGLLIGSALAEPSRTVVSTPVSTANQMARFSKDLQCESGANVYVAAVVYSYNTLSCGCLTEPQKCPIGVTPRDLNNISSSCWTSSTCTLNFSTSPETCSLVNATITYVCAPVNPSLTINRQSSHTGSSLTAGYSVTSDPGALWVCSVEAWDCSSVDVALTLFIRNGNDTVSYFSVPGGRLGVEGVATRPWTFQTPFNVDLNVVPGSALLNAYFTVQAERNLTVSCGRRSGDPPTVFCRSAAAVSFRTADATPVSNDNQIVRFSKGLLCESGTNVYVAAVFYTYTRLSCQCQTGLQKCPFGVESSDLNSISSSCWTSSSCTLTFSTPPDTCPHVTATITYMCAPVNPILTINRQSSDTGSSFTAGYSATSDPGALWVCTVEAWDCSSVNVTLTLFIRNGNDTVSYFSVPGGRLGVVGVSTREWTFPTPFNVDLNVLPGSALLNALLTVQGERNMTVTCGRRTGSPPTAFCNLPFVSMSPSSKFGRALTAVHSSSGVETDNSTWVCVVETADCSSGTPVDMFVLISNRGSTPASFFSLDEQRLNANYSGSLNTPVFVALHLVKGSEVNNAYVHVRAKENVSMTCERLTNTPTTLCNINECARVPSPCDVTAHCNNTEGSFHCYCDPGYSLTDNGRGCIGPPINDVQMPPSLVGPGVGGAVGAAVVIAVVVAAFVVVRRARTSKNSARRRAGGSPASQLERDNLGFDGTVPGSDQAEQARNDYMNVTAHPLNMAPSTSAVTSHADQQYYNVGGGGVPSNAEGAYEPLDQRSRDDVRMANTYQALRPGATSVGGRSQTGDVTTLYESLDRDTRDDVTAATPYQVLKL